MEFDLEEYRTQRQLREKRRRDFINRFEVVKAKLGGKVLPVAPAAVHHVESHISHVSHASHVSHPPEPQVEKTNITPPPVTEDLTALEAENKHLKEQVHLPLDYSWLRRRKSLGRDSASSKKRSTHSRKTI